MEKRKFIRFLKYRLPVIIWGILIIVISSLPHISGVKTGDFPLDKIAHLIEYGGFNFLLARALYFTERISLKKRALLLSFIISVFFAAADELHQMYIPGRMSSIYDFWADLGGIFISLILFIRITRPDFSDENN